MGIQGMKSTRSSKDTALHLVRREQAERTRHNCQVNTLDRVENGRNESVQKGMHETVAMDSWCYWTLRTVWLVCSQILLTAIWNGQWGETDEGDRLTQASGLVVIGHGHLSTSMSEMKNSRRYWHSVFGLPILPVVVCYVSCHSCFRERNSKGGLRAGRAERLWNASVSTMFCSTATQGMGFEDKRRPSRNPRTTSFSCSSPPFNRFSLRSSHSLFFQSFRATSHSLDPSQLVK